MSTKEFFNKPYDEGTLTKLQLFELYAEAWLPVFLSQPKPRFAEIHLFDFFAGPGTDSDGVYGSPLRLLSQLRAYQQMGMAGWDKVNIVVHLYDEDHRKIESLSDRVAQSDWKIPGVKLDIATLPFHEALHQHESELSNANAAKLLIIDQFGVGEVSDAVFAKLISFPTADFMFFLASSTLHRFRNHPNIKQKIDRPEDSYDVHRAAVDYYRKLVLKSGEGVYLAPFSIRKRSNIYGLIFGSHHPLGMHKFLQIAWKNDEIAGEANFDIEHTHIRPDELVLPLNIMQSDKVRLFESELEDAIRSGTMKTEADLVRFCLESGMTCQHSVPVLKKLKTEGIIKLDFRVPDVGRLRNPRPITELES